MSDGKPELEDDARRVGQRPIIVQRPEREWSRYRALPFLGEVQCLDIAFTESPFLVLRAA